MHPCRVWELSCREPAQLALAGLLALDVDAELEPEEELDDEPDEELEEELDEEPDDESLDEELLPEAAFGALTVLLDEERLSVR